MAGSLNNRIVKALILCLVGCNILITECPARPPERGSFTIPQMTIAYNNVLSLIDSVIDFGISKNAVAPEYDIYISYAKIEIGDRYSNDYYLTIWLDRTDNIPWSNLWYACYNYRGYSIFMNELFAYMFTDGQKINNLTFDYSYESNRTIVIPIYEWHYLISLDLKFEKLKESQYPLDKRWIEISDRQQIYLE